MSRLIVEGRLVDAERGPENGQVAIEDGRIVAVGSGLGPANLRFPDDHLIFPGFGDIHVHLREGQEYKEDFQTGAQAALRGGVTFVLDMPNNPEPPIDPAGIARKVAKAADAPIRIGFYAGVGPDTSPFGHSHYKVFMASSFGPLFFDQLDQLDPVMERYRGCRVTFHCEDPQALIEADTHEGSRPAAAEAMAVGKCVELARRFALQANVAHLSTLGGLRALQAAGPDRPTCEVTPHHLFFDVENRREFARNTFLKMNPPLRSPQDRAALLQALRAGDIDYLATDHAPHTLEEKGGKNPPGVPGLDTYGGFATWLLLEQEFTPQQIARHCAALPARWLNEPRGALQTGLVGDLCVLDLGRGQTVRAEDMATRCGWSPFEGVTFPGRVAATIVGGRVYSWD